MKNIMKRMLVIALAVMMVLSVASCGKNGGASGEIPTLVWYVPGDAQADMALVLEEANKIIEPAIGAKLDLQFIDQASYTERMQMLMASQTEFDLMLTGYVNNFANAYQKGGLMDITEYVKDDKELYKMLPDYAWDAASFEGQIYAVPNEQIWASCWAFAMRKDLVEKYGYDINNFKSMDDAWGFWELVQKNDPDLIPLYMSTGTDPYKINKYESIAGETYWDVDKGEFVIYTTSDANRKHAAYKKELFDKGILRKDIATATNETADYKAGRYATTLFVYKPGVELVKKIESGLDWIMVPISQPYTTRSSINATMTAVSATSKNPEKAVELIKLINTNLDLYRLICHGIEGKHYEKISDNMIKYLPESGYMVSADWKFGNQFNAYVLEGQPDDVWEATRKLNNESTISPLIGFSFVQDPIQTELAQISTITARYPMTKGLVDVNDDAVWKQYVSDLEKAGVKRVYDEVVKQYNEFKK